jgi:hypothetical protein
VFGQQVIKFIIRNERAGENRSIPVNADSNDGFGIGMALDTLRIWTDRMRGAAPAHHVDRLLLFSSDGKVRAFGNPESDEPISRDRAWTYAVRSFRARHGLPAMSLAMIRCTILDELHVRTGDVLLSKALGRRRHTGTTWSHYRSDGTKRRYRERLGEVFMLRERWVHTAGVIDPRERTASQDRGAAAPGFFCFDPLDSPQADQSKGRLCSAYGKCPGCPLAVAELSDPVNVACYAALRLAIAQSKDHLSATGIVTLIDRGRVLPEWNEHSAVMLPSGRTSPRSKP